MRFLISTRAWRSTTPGPTGSRTRRSTTKRCAGRWRPCWPSSATSSVTRSCSGPIVTSGSAQTRELVAQTGDGQRVDTLTTLRTAVTGRRYGLPQQNHPSDVLAEAYIDVLERRLHRANAVSGGTATTSHRHRLVVRRVGHRRPARARGAAHRPDAQRLQDRHPPRGYV